MPDRKKKYRRMYMHTIDGLPAAFFVNQIVFWSNGWHTEKLAANLRQIRREQAASVRYRRKYGFPDDLRYSYIIVRIEPC